MHVRHFFTFAVTAFILLISQAHAQGNFLGREPDGEILTRPVCSVLINRSNQTIMGTLSTMAVQRPDGAMEAFSENFRLERGDQKNFCASGPFYEGRRIQLVIRTLLPLFSCKTKIDRNIYLDAIEDSDGFTKLTATCS